MATKQAHHVTLPIARDIATRNLWARVTPEHGSDFASIDIHVDDDGEEKLIEILAKPGSWFFDLEESSRSESGGVETGVGAAGGGGSACPPLRSSLSKHQRAASPE